MGQILKKTLRCLVAAIFFAGALYLGIRPSQERPHYRPVLKLNHCADEQVGSVHYYFFQSPLCEFYTPKKNALKNLYRAIMTRVAIHNS